MKKLRWSKFFSRGQHPVLINDLIWQTLIIQPKIIGLPRLNFYKRDTKSTYFNQKESERFLYILKNQLKKKPVWLFKNLQRMEKTSQSLIHLAKKYNFQNWQKLSDKELKSKLIFFLERFIPFFCSVYYPLWLQQIGEELLHELLKKVELKKREEILWQIIRPYKLTTKEKFNLALLKLACELKKSKHPNKKIKTKIYQNKIEKIIKNFGFLPTYLLNVKFYTKKEIEKEIRNLLLHDPCQKRTEKLLSFKQQKKRKLLFKDLDYKIEKIADVISLDTWLREERIAWYGKIFSLIYPLFCEMAKRQKMTYQEIIQQTISEIKTGNISNQEIQNRLKGYAYIVKNNIVTILPYKRKIEITGKTQIIKGQIAHPGKAKGKVRIGTAYTFYQIKHGEIVVTGMTTPESTTFLRKAAAIVTDEGGITCHASIISRELKKPCIVGTKIATKVLKDGDLVEVDANKGVVKILKR